MPDSSQKSPAPAGDRETIWTRPVRGARGPHPQHSRAEIAAAAVALADSGGLSAASMRAVAEALGSSAGSLYRYLSSRDDLLDLMVDAVLAELRLNLPSTGSWLDDLVGLANDQLVLYGRHSWLLEVTVRGGALGPHATDYFEDCLRIMAPLDRDSATKLEAVAMITGVVSLFAQAAAQGPAASSSNPFVTASAQSHPHLISALTQPGTHAQRPNLFERTMRSVLGGLLADSS